MGDTLRRSRAAALKCWLLAHSPRGLIYVSPSGVFEFCTACRNTRKVQYDA